MFVKIFIFSCISELGDEPPRLMLTKSGLLSIQYCRALTRPEYVPLPLSLKPFMHNAFVLGATPTIPLSLSLAHIIPTQCV